MILVYDVLGEILSPDTLYEALLGLHCSSSLQLFSLLWGPSAFSLASASGTQLSQTEIRIFYHFTLKMADLATSVILTDEMLCYDAFH